MRQPLSNRGFTLIEVMIALVLLTGVVLAMGHGTVKFLSTITRNRIRIQAAAVADAQIASMRVASDYATLNATFGGTLNGVPFVNYSRVTLAVRTGAGTTADRTRVRVTVTGPQLATPVIRYTTIAAP